MCEKVVTKANWAKKSTSFTSTRSPNFCQLYAPSFGIASTRGETLKVPYLVKESLVLIRFSDNFYADNAILTKVSELSITIFAVKWQEGFQESEFIEVYM